MPATMMKTAWQLVTGTRSFYYKKVAEAARGIRAKTILEIGSGRRVNGRLVYSVKHLFDPSNEFICSDLNPAFGHQILDLTTLQETERYDVILCLNVLEHIFDKASAIRNLHRALKRGGVAYVAVPFLFPLHDEPDDYWRFTEHSLRRLLGEMFGSVEVSHRGPRRLPFGYFVEARKLS